MVDAHSRDIASRKNLFLFNGSLTDDSGLCFLHNILNVTRLEMIGPLPPLAFSGHVKLLD
jgi:hypothetical protein